MQPFDQLRRFLQLDLTIGLGDRFGYASLAAF
jgi:hypothetical protein